MKRFVQSFRGACGWALAGVAALGLPVLAQAANFGPLTVTAGFGQAQAEGFTSGNYSLTNVVGRDRSGDLCLGYAGTTPDHILTLEQDFEQLTLAVSSGRDTTLLVQGPNDNTVRCNDNPDRNTPDARITDSWQAGTYRVWIGSFEQGQQFDYVLRVSE